MKPITAASAASLPALAAETPSAMQATMPLVGSSAASGMWTPRQSSFCGLGPAAVKSPAVSSIRPVRCMLTMVTRRKSLRHLDELHRAIFRNLGNMALRLGEEAGGKQAEHR